jgi:hypothetical protein
VLAENVSLREAWDVITGRWSAVFSEAVDILRRLPDVATPATQPS